MLVHASSFTVDLGENGYLIGFTDKLEYPRGRCPSAGAAVRPPTPAPSSSPPPTPAPSS